MHDFKKEIKAERLRKRFASCKMPAEERFIRTGEMTQGFSSLKALKHIERFITLNWRALETKALNEGVKKLPVSLMMKINIKQMSSRERIYGSLPESAVSMLRFQFAPVVNVLLGYPRDAQEVVDRMAGMTQAMSLASIIYTYNITGTLKRALSFYSAIEKAPLRRYMIANESDGTRVFIHPYFVDDLRTASYVAVRMLGMMGGVKEPEILARMTEAHRIFRISSRNKGIGAILRVIPSASAWDIVSFNDKLKEGQDRAGDLGWLMGKSIYEYENSMENLRLGEQLIYMFSQGLEILPSEIQLTKSVESTNYGRWVRYLRNNYHGLVKKRCSSPPMADYEFFDTLEFSWFTMPWAQQSDSETE
jgi:hypothetical protein